MIEQIECELSKLYLEINQRPAKDGLGIMAEIEQLEELLQKEKQRRWDRESKARKRAKLREQGFSEYIRPVRREHFPLMDKRLAELNKIE